ncbi:hypothetical protein [Shewanella livingstonensis]|uniref:PLD phosphodiesterase domain-containing protein n=1 Tax=Shewanella livingstonensis TaxID=150120 RepID=A0A3G8LU62_9GAMM|nr:hypothetical protein [Shewanella livingstonensis]AZG72218.1 hypothetical protein EGC82_05210 [Shewanella livingstonensis]
MSKIARHAYEEYETSQTAFEGFKLSDEFDFSNVTIKDVLFRETYVDARHLIKKSKVSTLTVMTYIVGDRFPNVIHDFIENAEDGLTLNVAFCCEYVNNAKKDKKQLDGLIKAFEGILAYKHVDSIEIIANPHTHIKLLQCDDDLFVGSMNFSSTSEDTKASEDEKHYKNHRNYELMLHLGSGHKLATCIWDKLYLAEGSVTGTLNENNVTQVLTCIHKQCQRIPFDVNSAREKRLDIEKRIDDGIEDKLLIKEATAKAIYHTLDDMLTISMFNGFESLDYDDYMMIYDLLVGDTDLFWPDVLANCQFLEETENHEGDLISIAQEEVGNTLFDLTFEEEIIHENIREDKLDCDFILASGEEIPFGENSEDAKKKQMNQNQECVQRCLDDVADALTKYFIEHHLCKIKAKQN